MSDISDYVSSLYPHNKATVLTAEDIHISKVAIGESVDELEGLGGVKCRVAHLNDKTLDIKLIIAPACPSIPRSVRGGATPP